MIRVTYQLGATVTIVVDEGDAVLVDELADLAVDAADAALADVATPGAAVSLIGPPYVEDVEHDVDPVEVPS